MGGMGLRFPLLFPLFPTMSLPHHGQSETTVTPLASSAATSVQLTLVSLRSTMSPPPKPVLSSRG